MNEQLDHVQYRGICNVQFLCRGNFKCTALDEVAAIS